MRRSQQNQNFVISRSFRRAGSVPTTFVARLYYHCRIVRCVVQAYNSSQADLKPGGKSGKRLPAGNTICSSFAGSIPASWFRRLPRRLDGEHKRVGLAVYHCHQA